MANNTRHYITATNRVCYCPHCGPAWRAWAVVMHAIAAKRRREQTALAADMRRILDMSELAAWLAQDVH